MALDVLGEGHAGERRHRQVELGGQLPDLAGELLRHAERYPRRLSRVRRERRPATPNHDRLDRVEAKASST